MMTHDAWRRLHNGEYCTTRELKEMLAQVEAAMPLLCAHADMGAAQFRAAFDRDSIIGYLAARKTDK